MVEVARPIRPIEAGVYYKEFAGMLVANAVCRVCMARYLAWCGAIPGRGPSMPGTFEDLSHLSTFNDEWGEADLPVWKVTREPTLTRWVRDE
jgi:hypothetical protein